MGIAVVTGASGGIGSAIAQRLASDGMSVVVGYGSSAERAAAVVESLDTLAGQAHAATAIPVTDSDALAAVAADLAEQHGAIDVLVNCAGKTQPVAHDDLDGLTDDVIDDIFATNWRGPFACVRAFRSLLDDAADPVIVNISSVSGVTGQGSNVAYCASKAALDSMTRSLARALGPKIRVVSVSPGWVLGDYAARMPTEILDTQRDATPLARLATGDDVAAAVSAVVRDLPFTTGTIISVDGGRPLGTN
jgi:3-oxoacyl-[acyl-carrier protein] reductase